VGNRSARRAERAEIWPEWLDPISRLAVVTRPLPLRADVPPDDATVVLRAGVMSGNNVRRAAERTFAIYAVYGISVEGVIGTTMQEACRAERIVSYHRVRLSSFGRVRQAGFALLATFDHPALHACPRRSLGTDPCQAGPVLRRPDPQPGSSHRGVD
jgi:hypothetical protein